jgi:hypothetical protein
MIKSKLTKEHLIKIIIENHKELRNINISLFTKLLRFDWSYESYKYDDYLNMYFDGCFFLNKKPNIKYIIYFKNRIFGTYYTKYPEELSKKQLIKIAECIKQPTKLLFYD